MQSTEITFDNLGETGTLFTALLRARYHHFIETRGWKLPNTRGLEFDQYDTPESIYCTIHDGLTVYGGLRVTPTTAHNINASYMLRDAQLGLLPDMPTNLLDEPAPQDPGTWEVSRVFVTDTLSSRDRMRVRSEIGLALARLAETWKFDSYICLTSVAAGLLMRRTGLTISPAGPRLEVGGETCQAYHLKVDAKNVRSHAA
ncbi:acyl-homoserine-lactone synthase [Pseudophaeobacter sp.]|jgi:N-acyl-L-homoserine lactone synthetase|uniref:Acyl-homoserine-lactone synthase n=1 Tax=Pseudophaeobacter arcticus TaxID=385492 RepID=A0ABQ0AL29_9RHOB|nr:acyl-homoserine-lactone synthase [Pseudophaeobacter sp.]UWS80863.1 autoinducer synthase [Phaeobacter sp. G2]